MELRQGLDGAAQEAHARADYCDPEERSAGMNNSDLSRKHGISYNWNAEYGASRVSEVTDDARCQLG
jgi:hypothetical protein